VELAVSPRALKHHDAEVHGARSSSLCGFNPTLPCPS
jgi:hypothetical protein